MGLEGVLRARSGARGPHDRELPDGAAVAVDALASRQPKVVALLGSGTLARSHAQALRAVREIAQMRVWSRDPANVERCAREIGAAGVPSAEAAVRGADIVCTVTNASEPVLWENAA